MNIILAPLVGTKNYDKVDNLEIELPQVPQIGSILEFGDYTYNVIDIFYTFDDNNKLKCIYARINDHY